MDYADYYEERVIAECSICLTNFEKLLSLDTLIGDGNLII